MKRSFYLPGLLAAIFLFSSVAVKAVVPFITADPHNDTACSGARVKFFVSDTGTTPITYTWQISTDGTTWATLRDTLEFTGSSTDTLRILTDMSLRGTWYRAIASNTDGSDTSAAGLLVVDTTAGPIMGATSVCVGSSITLSNAVPGGVWSRVNRLIDTVTTAGIVSGISQGYDTVKYTVNNACGVSMKWLRMRVDTTVTGQPITGPTTTCVGHSITLSNVNVLGTGVWSVSNANAMISSTGILTGLAGGNDVVTYTFTNACNSVTSTVSITIDTVLSHGTISGASSVCAGSWVPLTETVSGGIWISSNTAVAVVDGAGHVTGVSQGTASISYLLSNGCGTSVATHSMTVYQPASVIVGLDSIGIGNTRTYFDTVAGGMWLSSDTAKLVIDTVTGAARGVAAGTAMISYIVTNTCGTTIATLLVHIGNPPSAGTLSTSGTGHTDSVCIGSNINVLSTVAGGVWTISNGDTVVHATITSAGVVHGLIMGQDTVYYTVSNGFGSTTVSRVVTIVHTPIISLTGPSIISLGGLYQIRGVPAGGIFTNTNNTVAQIISVYDSVYGGLSLVSFASIVVINGGTDVIHYRVTNMCGSADSTFTFSLPLDNGVHAVANNAEALKLYPNPTDGEFTLNLQSAVNESAVVTITNVAGEKVKELTISTNKNFDVKLNEPAGIYFISAKTSGGTYSSKVTIK
jgi:hypothetical protein